LFRGVSSEPRAVVVGILVSEDPESGGLHSIAEQDRNERRGHEEGRFRGFRPDTQTHNRLARNEIHLRGFQHVARPHHVHHTMRLLMSHPRVTWNIDHTCSIAVGDTPSPLKRIVSFAMGGKPGVAPSGNGARVTNVNSSSLPH
jgi:hypothetical protein